jgi:transketolase
MRKHFSEYIEHNLASLDDFIFITGDLGYNALEPLAAIMGDRFINAGVAEQNMIGVAAGMASQGYQVMCYSIAPFVVYRCLEQVRNDVCFHNLPVYITGNGGGYGYGIMGSSHHAIEDIGVLSGLPNMTCYVPAFLDDMRTGLSEMVQRRGPAYVRLGLGKPMPEGMVRTSFGGYLPAVGKSKLTVIVQSPVANNALSALAGNDAVDFFVISKMPLTALPAEVSQSVRTTGRVVVVEEHIATGGLSAAMALLLKIENIATEAFTALHATGYPEGLYGNQAYHQQQSGLDTANIARIVSDLTKF